MFFIFSLVWWVRGTREVPARFTEFVTNLFALYSPYVIAYDASAVLSIIRRHLQEWEQRSTGKLQVGAMLLEPESGLIRLKPCEFPTHARGSFNARQAALASSRPRSGIAFRTI